MDFTVVIARPPGYPHSGAFTELAELVAHGFADLGHGASVAVNRARPGTRTILIGCHLLNPTLAGDLRADTIILNTEQVHDELKVNARLGEWVRHFEIWDYSARNIEALAGLTTQPVKHLKLGYHPALARIESAPEPDIDVLFYGTRNERRLRVLRRLAGEGVKVHSVYGVYGPERDALIARSRIVLNMHYYATQIFEIVRVFYLMTNRKAVVSEINADTAVDPIYRDGIEGAAYEELTGACLRHLADPAERRALEDKAFAAIRRLPQAELLAPLL
jgi:hypothetical protein